MNGSEHDDDLEATVEEGAELESEGYTPEDENATLSEPLEPERGDDEDDSEADL